MKLAAGAGLIATGSIRAIPSVTSFGATLPGTGSLEDRGRWIESAVRLAEPVLEAPLRGHKALCYLETVGCLLHGLAPWLELAGEAPAVRLADLARQRLSEAVMAANDSQVTAESAPSRLFASALLAQVLLRAPQALWTKLDSRTQQSVCALMRSAGSVQARNDDGRIYMSIIELAMRRFDGRGNGQRLYEGLRCQHSCGGNDSAEAGAVLFFQQPKALVVRSMRLDALEGVATVEPTWRAYRDAERAHFSGLAGFEEKLVAPDGSYALRDRSDVYRCGVFQGLAVSAWRKILPATVQPGQARAALSAVLARSLEDPAAFDRHGWLQAPSSAAIDSESVRFLQSDLYLCSVALLPLGLPRHDSFWVDATAPLSWSQFWPASNTASIT